jgi:hypothetical protein
MYYGKHKSKSEGQSARTALDARLLSRYVAQTPMLRLLTSIIEPPALLSLNLITDTVHEYDTTRVCLEAEPGLRPVFFCVDTVITHRSG